MELLVFLVCFLACGVGAVAGVGGGIIIKPVLDATGIMNSVQISFLSGCTVLTMTAYSVISKHLTNKSGSNSTTRTRFLALGAIIGGIVGKTLFDLLVATVNTNLILIKRVQSGILLALVMLTFLYMVREDKIKTYNVENGFLLVVIGLALGLMSSFLGIGGGPFNLMFLSFFLSMGTKDAASNSLYIILWSQLASLVETIILGKVPDVNMMYLVIMVIAGLLGGVIGRKINSKISEKAVRMTFLGLIVLIMAICIYNMNLFA